jgi:hypothetical protein
MEHAILELVETDGRQHREQLLRALQRKQITLVANATRSLGGLHQLTS